jgi:hypothetical protein
MSVAANGLGWDDSSWTVGGTDRAAEYPHGG